MGTPARPSQRDGQECPSYIQRRLPCVIRIRSETSTADSVGKRVGTQMTPSMPSTRFPTEVAAAA